MNTEALFIFLILLLGLVLCSFLGGENIQEGFEHNDNHMKSLQASSNNNNNKNKNNNEYDNYNHYNGKNRLIEKYTNYNDSRENRDNREDVYDNREDVVDNRYNGGRADKREDVYDNREDVYDNRYNGPGDALPPGIPRSQIRAGQEDLYILKSEIVPPVCPACPTSAACPRQEPCQPCPACARCPEPAFECKKVPNYNAIGNDYLPAPVLADFSTFGM